MMSDQLSTEEDRRGEEIPSDNEDSFERPRLIDQLYEHVLIPTLVTIENNAAFVSLGITCFAVAYWFS